MKLKEHFAISKRAFGLMFRWERRFTILQMTTSFLTAAGPYIPIWFSAKLVDALAAGESLPVLAKYAALTVGLAFLTQGMGTWLSSFQQQAEQATNRDETWRFSEKAMEMAYTSIEDPEVTRLRYRIESESMTGHNRFYLHMAIQVCIRNGTMIAASLAMTAAFFATPTLSLWVKLGIVAGLLVTMLVTVYASFKEERALEHFWNNASEQNALSMRFDEYIEDYAAGKDIRLYGMRNWLVGYDKKITRFFLDGWKPVLQTRLIWRIPRVAVEKLFQFGLYAALIFAALAGGISVGDIAKYVACLLLLVNAVTELTDLSQLIFQIHHYLARYFSYFDIPNEMYKGSLTVEKRDDREYDVEFRDVSFRYPNTDAYALRHVSLKIKVGEKLAIVGMNGSGKTTFIKLLCRLYDPTEGEILLNGVDIRKYDYDEYMSIFSVVFQDFRLFPFTLGEVVASSRDYDAERVKDCLRQANFGARLETMPKGLDTCLYKTFDGEGVEISGGEAQKIALARALYKNAAFILLDEPTAALDPVSEYEVYRDFNAITGDRTAVYISHRLASCRFCDKIAVFHEGRIVQTGAHEALLADEGGKYAELWHAQAQYYK